MIKSSKHLSGFSKGIDQDTSVNKIGPDFYYDAENFRLISNDPSSSGALSTVRGNTLSLTFATGDVIVGYCKIRCNFSTSTDKDSIVFFVHNSSAPTSRIYLFEGDPYKVGENVNMDATLTSHTSTGGYNYKSGYIYRNSSLNFSTSYPIKAEGRYESLNIRKIYWVDGLNNIRYMILDSVSTSDPVTIFDINPTASLTEAVGIVVPGGSYTSGLVQYSYQLYIRNGAATTYAPPSELLYLTANDKGFNSKSFSGSELNENTGKAVSLSISNLDTNYNRIRIIAIHYTELLVNPTINIVGEFEYSNNSITVIDNGYTVLGVIPIEEYRLFGQTNYIANSIASKNNYLFLANITEDKWNPLWLDPLDGTFWDSRAVRFRTSDNTAYVLDGDHGGTQISADFSDWDDFTYDRDGINTYNDTDNDGNPNHEYKFQHNGTTLGAEGPNVEIEFATEDLFIDTAYPGATAEDAQYADIPLNTYLQSPVLSSHRSSQRTEVYRTYIVFYNTKMQFSQPQWICDLRMPSNSDADFLTVVLGISDNRMARYVYPKVTIKNLPSDDNLYGWQIFRCERGSNDRSVLASGVLSPCHQSTIDGVTNLNRPYSSDTEWPYAFTVAEDMPAVVNDNVIEVVSPEISFNKNLTYIGGDKLRIEGRYGVEGVKKVVIDDDVLITLSLGQTYARDVSDTENYSLTDGSFQTPGLVSGDPISWPPVQSIGGYSFRNILRFAEFCGSRGSNFIAVINESLSLGVGSWGVPYGSYVRNVFNVQYGGNTYEARSYNSVIPYSSIVPKATTNVTCYRGDTHITMFAYLRSAIPDSPDVSWQQEMVYIPVESSINSFYRSDLIQKYYNPSTTTYKLQETLQQGMVVQPLDYPIELGDLYRYNPVYSKSGDANLIQNNIFDSNNIEHSDVKIIATGKKINNEYFDSWTNLYTNNYIEVDPKYGAIENIFTINNKLFCGQDKAISVIAVNDRSLIQDNNRIQLTLGTGGVLERYDYLTTTSGFQNYFDMVLSDKTFYYLDRRNKIIYTFTEDGDTPISEINGYRSFLKSYDLMSTVKTGFDPVYKELFFYINGTTSTTETPSDSFSDWYLPSSDEVGLMYTNLFLNDIGNFVTGKGYVTSSESDHNGESYRARIIWFWQFTTYSPDGNPLIHNKYDIVFTTRPSRTFITTTIYNIQDIGPTGGWIYNVVNNGGGYYTYYEAAPEDIEGVSDWSNIIDVEVGTSTAVGSGQANTTAIINQVGHTHSAAKVCNDLIVTTGSGSTGNSSLVKNSVYDEYVKAFIGKHTFSPDLMLNLNDQFYSVLGNTIYLHNYGDYGKFYGTISDSTITKIINPNGNAVNIFDTVELRVDVKNGDVFYEDEQFDHIDISNNYQNTVRPLHFSGDDSLEDTTKALVRKWRIPLLPEDTTADFYRFNDTFVKIKLTKHNTDNKKTILHDIITYFRNIRG